VPIAELETFTAAQQKAIVTAANQGWARLAVQILLGIDMRCEELAALTVSDFEDDGEVGFLKVRHGKGAKFRRVPLSSRLRREVGRYINRYRIDTGSDRLLLRSDGEPVRMMTVEYLLGRIKDRVATWSGSAEFWVTLATSW
jgi:integrase